MKKISILLLVLWGVIPSMLFAQRQLSFQNGKFKIVQFTDLHWTSGSPKCAETERTIRTILKSGYCHIDWRHSDRSPCN